MDICLFNYADRGLRQGDANAVTPDDLPIRILLDGSPVDPNIVCPYYTPAENAMAEWARFAQALSEPDGKHPGLLGTTICGWCRNRFESEPASTHERVQEVEAQRARALDDYKAYWKALNARRLFPICCGDCN